MGVQMKALQSRVPSLTAVSVHREQGWAEAAQLCPWCCLQRGREGREVHLGPVLKGGVDGLEPPHHLIQYTCPTPGGGGGRV